MQQATIYQQYTSQSLQTLTQGELVVKLFEEASKQVSTAIFLTNQNNSYKAFNCIKKAQKIISTLNASLDMNYAISIELSDIYGFLHKMLGESAAEQDAKLMKDLLAIIDDLKVTFRQAEKLARAKGY